MIPSAATLRSFTGQSYPSVIVRGRDTKVQLPAYYEGALVAPSSCTYALYKQDGNAIASGSCTIVASVATYTLTSSVIPSTTTPGEGYSERWVFTFSGDVAPVEIIRTACIVAAPIYPAVSDSDLIAQYHGLSDYRAGSLASYQVPITEAWGQLMARLVRGGRLPYCIRTPDGLREAHLHLSLALVFQGFGLAENGEHWRKLAKDERESYEKSFQEMTVQMDMDQDKVVDNPRARTAGPTPTMMSPAVGRWAAVWRRV